MQSLKTRPTSLLGNNKRRKTKILNPLSTNLTKWSNTRTIRRLLLTNCFSVFDHIVGLAFKGNSLSLRKCISSVFTYFPLFKTWTVHFSIPHSISCHFKHWTNAFLLQIHKFSFFIRRWLIFLTITRY